MIINTTSLLQEIMSSIHQFNSSRLLQDKATKIKMHSTLYRHMLERFYTTGAGVCTLYGLKVEVTDTIKEFEVV